MSLPQVAVTSPLYLEYLRSDPRKINTADGKDIILYSLEIPREDHILTDWAQRFRANYRTEDEIEEDCHDMSISPSEYLLNHVFPTRTDSLGPSIRAGDFTELLVADYLEYLFEYWVPRVKYSTKISPNESVQGGDVLGMALRNPEGSSSDDELIVFEVKSRLSDRSDTEPGRLQDAIDHSSKDFARLAYTLNGTKQLYRARGDQAGVAAIARFQNIADRPYKLLFGAAAVLSDKAFDLELVTRSETSAHEHNEEMWLLVIHGHDLMTLVHDLYGRAAHEA